MSRYDRVATSRELTTCGSCFCEAYLVRKYIFMKTCPIRTYIRLNQHLLYITNVEIVQLLRSYTSPCVCIYVYIFHVCIRYLLHFPVVPSVIQSVKTSSAHFHRSFHHTAHKYPPSLRLHSMILRIHSNRVGEN